MVGVAGRSKACKTCKQRKIACSLERPHCQICIKSKRECGGYKQEMVFVMDPRTAKAAKGPDRPKPVVKNQEIDVTSPASTIEIPYREPELRITSAPDLEASIPTSSAFTHLTSISSPTIRAVYREQIVSEFLHTFIPPLRIATPGSWLTLLPTHKNYTSALEATTLAISTARLGRLNSDRALVHESLKFYTQGLWELQRALWDEKTMYKDETLAACLTLIMYEVFECPDSSTKAWIGHMNGCRKLFELRGPGNYKSEFGWRLFSSFRALEIPHTITERRTTFLASKDWVEIPFKGRVKVPAHQILDLMAEIANTIGAGYKALGDPTAITNIQELALTVLGILKSAWSSDMKLEAFFKRLQSETNGPVYWTQLSNGYNKSLLPNEELDIFPVAFYFPDMVMAQTCMLYWSTCCILWSGMGFIYRFLSLLPTIPPDHTSNPTPVTIPTPADLLSAASSSTSSPASAASPTPPASAPTLTSPPPAPPTPPTPNPLLAAFPPLGHRTDVSLMAKNICQSLEYYLQADTAGGGAASTAVFPLKVAIESLSTSPGCEKELAWATEMFSKICGRGLRILGNLGVELTSKTYLPG